MRKGNENLNPSGKYTLKLRVYYHWDIELKGYEVKGVLDEFYAKNKPTKNKEVYHMVEEKNERRKD